MRGVQHLRELLLAQFQLQSALPYVLSKSRRRSRSNKLVDELDAIRCHPLFQGDMALNTKRTNTQQHPGAGVSIETEWWVKVPESMADTAAPAVDQSRFVRPPVTVKL